MQITFMTFCSARLVRKLGIKRMVLLIAVVQAAALLLMPLSQVFLPPVARLPVLASLYAANACCNATGAVVAITATNKSSVRHPKRKGTINGVATTMESIGKGIGPALGASLFALALERGSGAGARSFFVCFAASVALLYGVLAACIPISFDAPRLVPPISQTRQVVASSTPAVEFSAATTAEPFVSGAPSADLPGARL